MKALLGLLLALAFFGAVTVVFALAASISMAAVYLIIGLGMLGILFQATGGRALLGTRERPERLLGARLRFHAVDYHPELTDLPDAVVQEWDGRQYRVQFLEPLSTSQRERGAMLSSRWEGCPISRVSSWRGAAVSGLLTGGDGFIAMGRRVR